MPIAAPLNTEAYPILQWIEVATSLSIPSFQIIGLPSPEVAEARDRVRAAIESSGLEFPRRRVVVNLSPASIRKRGTGLDLAMALAILEEAAPPVSSTQSDPLPAFAAWGELGLNGRVKSAGQVTRTLFSTWQASVPFLILSQEDFAEAVEKAAWIRESGGLPGREPQLIAVSTLADAWAVVSMRGTAVNTPEAAATPSRLRLVRKLEAVGDNAAELLPLPPSLERIVGVAASGEHHLLLLGPRGAGKSHAAEWVIALQPSFAPLALLRHQLFSELNPSAAVDNRPIRPIRKISPQVRPGALIGHAGPAALRPGEFTLADGGLLIADEILEWPRDSREMLREPLEHGRITLTRAAQQGGSAALPACFTLVASGNLCPCGGWPAAVPAPDERDSFPICICSEPAQRAYLGRLSGPILDRIDLISIIRAKLPPPARDASARGRLAALRERAEGTRARIVSRYGMPAGRIPAVQIEALCHENPEWEAWLGLRKPASLRARHRLVRTAITLAAWDGRDLPSEAHFTEAATYRIESCGIGVHPA